LARELRALGARVVEAPVIRTRALEDTAPAGAGAPESGPLNLTRYDLVCFTSANGVDALFDRLASAPSHEGPRDARALAGARVAAIGPGTARALREHGIVADVVPERFVAESLVEALAEIPIERALVARAREARDVLPDALRARGAEVEVLALYETVAEPLLPRVLEQARAADYITFTSSSTVRFFLQATHATGGSAKPTDRNAEPAGGNAEPADGDVQAAGNGTGLSPQTRIVSIGPVTSATLREHGLEPHIEARRHDVEGVVQALLADAAARDVV
jgi:uroporphyrinogen III methyltransferase/synthase